MAPTPKELGRVVTTFPKEHLKVSRSLLEFCNKKTFSKMNDDELCNHIVAHRDVVYRLATWPALGWFLHMPPLVRKMLPTGEYDKIIKELCADRSRKVLDLGCMFGHDARAMIQDGVKPQQVTMSDLKPELLQMGQTLFADDPKTSPHLQGVTMKAADIFKDEDIKNLEVPGGYHAIHIGIFLHLFPEDSQRIALKMIDRLLSKMPGSVIIGSQLGRHEGDDSYKILKKDGDSVKHGPRGVVAESNGQKPTATPQTPASFTKMFETAASGDWETHLEFSAWDLLPGDGEVMMSVKRAEFIAGKNIMLFALRRK